MLDAYRDSDGLARCPEALALFRRRFGSDARILTRRMVEHEVVCFEWQSQTWFPLFQFRGMDFAPARGDCFRY